MELTRREFLVLMAGLTQIDDVILSAPCDDQVEFENSYGLAGYGEIAAREVLFV